MIKIKKIIKWFFLIIIFIIIALIVFIILNETGVIQLPKNPIPNLNKTDINKIREWEENDHNGRTNYMIEFYYNKFDCLNGIGYYQQQLNDKTNKSSFEIMTIQDRLPVLCTLSIFINTIMIKLKKPK
ncbi:hypothetical protein J8J04_00245 ['Fragaria x ananassa' phyllody phytoplasma]|uniref:Effector n=1 Tax='Fragaria x ananassa' phyllody phytoplasma TaxID=2358428 RepID=A0ABS5K4J0_9MOLU|nr:hypothetical protein ['Fragaria x ananassa' phyllody phytoplasma]MBS2126155.1 hypothetical protein ['Fragaria x ananassa' phyllody phytoplasma]